MRRIRNGVYALAMALAFAGSVLMIHPTVSTSAPVQASASTTSPYYWTH